MRSQNGCLFCHDEGKQFFVLEEVLNTSWKTKKCYAEDFFTKTNV